MHPSTLVLVKDKNANDSGLRLKMLPFKPFFDFKEMEGNDEDIGFVKKGINFLISKQIMTNKVKIHALRKYWKHAFKL